MTTHLSVRLTWHDRGWDARVCDQPHLNSSCIVHEHIRESKDDDRERNASGVPLASLPDWLPPCSRDTGAFADIGYRAVHRDPLDWRNLPPVPEDLPAYSCCPSPYRWMREENFRDVCEAEDLKIRGPEMPRERGWINEPDRQLALLTSFWKKLEAGNSLIFFYCNQGNPLGEATARLLVGVSRLKEIGGQLYFGTNDRYPGDHPIWSRRVTQDFPAQGVRIPYQDYLREGHDTASIVATVPPGLIPYFSYVGEHLPDDVALAALERLIQSTEQVKADGLVPGDWEQRLGWLNDALSEVWSERGAYPGLGAVLKYLGCPTGIGYQRFVLGPMVKKGGDPWAHVLSILEGRKEPEDDQHRDGLSSARTRWEQVASKRELLATLARFELTLDQVARIADPDERAKSGISATEAEIVANPYVLAELDRGTAKSERVGLEIVDHGVRPEGDAALFVDANVAHDDRRRVRGVAAAVLGDGADAGDTLLSFDDLFDRIQKRFPDRRACRPDREVFWAESEFHGERLWLDKDHQPQLVGLKRLRDLETGVGDVVRRRGPKSITSDAAPDWRPALEARFGAPATDRGRAALSEKEVALRTLFGRRLSVLTGGAGTGKTSTVRVFIEELEKVEGREPVLLLAPTGKARVRLSKATSRNTMTIHQFLLRQGWFTDETFELKEVSEKPAEKAALVVVDECSMIPVDLFATLLKALDFGPLKRLVLVGDPYQLPPIGPGRPFVDAIDWLRENHPECLADLKIEMRRLEEEGRNEVSRALTLAEGYRSDVPDPADDEVLASVARAESEGDLGVVFWDTHDELVNRIEEQMWTQRGIKARDYKAFNASLGVDTKKWEMAESWQILTPTRTQPFGTDDLNRRVQQSFKGGLLTLGRSRSPKVPRPFGEQEIVGTDKVIQIVNRRKRGWPKEKSDLDYVANGEVGLVGWTDAQKLNVHFSTQPEVSYSYWRGEVDEQLELAYALTVHKAQGSDFDDVFLIVPLDAPTLSRELLYTALTRFRRHLTLFVEKDTASLLRLRNPDASETKNRNTLMFEVRLRPEGVKRPHLEALIHRTSKGIAVRSKSEVIVADTLHRLGISYDYEHPLYSKTDPRDFRLPDFTVSYEGETYYWEHLGMLTDPGYAAGWERKKVWYADNGYVERLITSEDQLNGGIDVEEIERTARESILDI